MEAGVLGFVQKSCMHRHLVHAIKAVLTGQPCIWSSILIPLATLLNEEVGHSHPGSHDSDDYAICW